MTVQFFQGNIFDSGAELIACFANGDGIPFGFGGQVAEVYPQAFRNHRKECLEIPRGKGAVDVYTDREAIAYVVIADKMKDQPTIGAIAKGLSTLHKVAKHLFYKSIAIMAQPERGISADEIKRLIRAEFDNSEVMVIVYTPDVDRDRILNELEQRFLNAMVVVKHDIEYSDRVGTIPAGAVGYIANYGVGTGVPFVDFGKYQVMLKWTEFLVQCQVDGTIVRKGGV